MATMFAVVKVDPQSMGGKRHQSGTQQLPNRQGVVYMTALQSVAVAVNCDVVSQRLTKPFDQRVT